MFEPTRHCSNCGIGPAMEFNSLCENCAASGFTGSMLPASYCMNLPRAVKILNDNKHRGRIGWTIVGDFEFGLVRGPSTRDELEPFEAIAVAEKYVREAK